MIKPPSLPLTAEREIAATLGAVRDAVYEVGRKIASESPNSHATQPSQIVGRAGRVRRCSGCFPRPVAQDSFCHRAPCTYFSRFANMTAPCALVSVTSGRKVPSG